MTTVFVVPHTHWDREWYETAARFRQRLVPVVDEVLDLLAGDPTFTCFLLDGQAVVLDDYLAVRPERREVVAGLVASGRLMAGPWYVLSDELLSSDECLVRNLLAGRHTVQGLGGDLPLGYSPDAFGHPAALPTILAGFGIQYGVLWRGYGGEPGQEGDLFRWRGPDGSVVLFHHLPPPGYEVGSGMPRDSVALRQWWAERDALLSPRAAGRPLLLPAGADHHAADPELPRLLRELGRSARGFEFRIASPLDYFAAVSGASPLPETAGEQRFSCRYTWTLQGVHSTRSGLKRQIFEGDRLLVRWAEPQAALAGWTGSRLALLRAAWRDHLLDHPHDSICGCVTDEVSRDIAGRAGSVSVQARGLLVDAVHDRLRQDRSTARREKGRWKPGLVIVNPQARRVSGIVEATITAFQDDVVVGGPDRRGSRPRAAGRPSLAGLRGEAIPLQVLDEFDAYERLDSPRDYPDQDRVRAFRVAVHIADIPPFGTRHLRVTESASGGNVEGEVSGTPAALVGAPGTVRANERRGFRLVSGSGESLGSLAHLVSERDEGDTYTHQPVRGDRPLQGRWSRPRLVWGGPLVGAVARDVYLGDRARATVTARVDAGSTLVRFTVDGVNTAGNHRLRIVFPGRPGHANDRAVADMQYGPVTRERRAYDRRDFPREWPVDTAPLQRYVSAAGITVFSRGAFEYELTADGALALTLFRAVGELSRGDLSARPGNAAWPAATPGAQELGPFRAEFAIAAAAVTESSPAASWEEVERLAEEFHAPCAGLMLRYGIDVLDEVHGPELFGRGLAFKALKPAEHGGGIVARCVNLTGDAVEGRWRWPVPARLAFLSRLDETPVGEIELEGERRDIRFVAGPRAVVTIIVEAAV